MFDPVLMRAMTPILDRAGLHLARRGWTANGVTWLGFSIGCGAALAVANGHTIIGLGCIALNRLCDGLDGAVARATARTDLGGYLDIVLDFIFYGLVTAAFAVADPANAIAASILLASFMATAASFLAFAIVAARRGVDGTSHGKKSFFFSWGLAEGFETIAFLVVVCLWPGTFVPLTTAFAVLCWLTAAQRITFAMDMFK